jgi:hypothetical protein
MHDAHVRFAWKALVSHALLHSHTKCRVFVMNTRDIASYLWRAASFPVFTCLGLRAC